MLFFNAAVLPEKVTIYVKRGWRAARLSKEPVIPPDKPIAKALIHAPLQCMHATRPGFFENADRSALEH